MAFEQLSQQLDEVLAAGVPVDQESVLTLFVLSTRLQAVLAEAAAGFDKSVDWQASGARTCKGYLTRTTRLPAAEVGRCLRLGRELPAMSFVAEALQTGEISTAHARMIMGVRNSRTAGSFERDEEFLVEQAKTLGWFSDFARAMQYWEQMADPDGSDDKAEELYNRRDVFLSPSFSGNYLGRINLDAISGAIVDNELDRLEQELFESDWSRAKNLLGRDPKPRELPRTSGQRRADGLVEMARRSAIAPVGGQAPSPLLTVLIDYETLQGRVCELANGTVIAPSQLVGLLDEAMIERAVFKADNRVEVSKRARFFTGAIRRAIELRDRSCTHPYCDLPACKCECDHIVEYAKGGETTQENGRLLCGFHNRQRNQRRGPPDRPTASAGDELDTISQDTSPPTVNQPPPPRVWPAAPEPPTLRPR